MPTRPSRPARSRLTLLGLTVLTLAAVPLYAAAPAAAPALPTVKQVVQQLDDLYRSKSSQATMTMKVVKRRGTRSLTMEMWTVGQDKALIVIRKPAREAGTATLRNKDGLYNYAPRADRLIRIPSGLLSSSWMGSHFSNDDLVRETSWDRDYSTKLSWATEGGKRVLRASMIPKPGAPVVYTEVRSIMDATRYFPIRTEYYDRGKLIRTMRFEDVKTVSGRHIPHRMILVPAKRPKERTEMIYESLKLDVSVPAATFTKRGLRRAAKR